MSFLSDFLGPLFLLSVGIGAIVGAWSAHQKAQRLYQNRETSSLQDQQNSAVAKAVAVAAFAAIVWYDSFDLDAAVVKVAVPLGVYKFAQLLLTPIFGLYFDSINPPANKEQLNG